MKIRILSILLALLLLLSACSRTTDPSPQSHENEPEPDCVPYNVTDHALTGPDYSVFDGLYRAKLPQNEDEETWLKISGGNDFILLEYHGLINGSVYRFWVEEFWPEEGWDSSEDNLSISGRSQTFSAMAQGNTYDGMPQNRALTLTNDGVVLNYDDSDAEYYARDDSWEGGHSSPEEMRGYLGAEVVANGLDGTWGYWTGEEAGSVTFTPDGRFSLFRKTPGMPIAVLRGIYTFGEADNRLQIFAEQIGHGKMPVAEDWEWLTDEYNNLLLAKEGQPDQWFYPIKEHFFTTLDAYTALGYLTTPFYSTGDYTDQYGTTYTYCFRIPAFLPSQNEALQAANEQIAARFEPIAEEEQRAMAQGEFLSYTNIDWESSIFDGILYLHVYAETFNREEHSAYYYDLETGALLTTEEVLDRLLIDPDYFLDAVRQGAEETFVSYFSGIPIGERQEYGYYDLLEWTVSDEAVNFDLPIFVDSQGSIAVYARIGSMAGASEFRTVLYPFDGTVG